MFLWLAYGYGEASVKVILDYVCRFHSVSNLVGCFAICAAICLLFSALCVDE